MSDSVRPHRWQPTRLPRPWDSPGKNAGVGCCHFLLQCMKVKSKSEVAQLCPTPSDTMDCSPPGPSVYGIFQARVLEWVAIALSKRSNFLGLLWFINQFSSMHCLFSSMWYLLICVQLFATPWIGAHQAPLSMGFPRQEYWSRLPFPSPEDHPDSRTDLGFPILQADSLPSYHQGSPLHYRVSQ